MHNSQVRTAFVLAGGGSLGAVEVGMLHTLTEHGLRPDFVVGASAGAINGAYFASDPTPRGVPKLDQLWRGLIRRQVMPMRLSDLRCRSSHSASTSSRMSPCKLPAIASMAFPSFTAWAATPCARIASSGLTLMPDLRCRCLSLRREIHAKT